MQSSVDVQVVVLIECIAAEDVEAVREHVRRHGLEVLRRCHRGTGRDPLTVAVVENAPKALEALLSLYREAGEVPELGFAFRECAGLGREACARVLLEAGADVAQAPVHGMPLLHEAVAAGHPAVALLLIEAGADVHEVSAPNARSKTALGLACAGGHTALARALIEAGARVDQPTDTMTPLHWCVLKERLETAQLLLERGADPQVRDYFGRTPAGLAQELGDAPMRDLFAAWHRADLISAHGVCTGAGQEGPAL